MSGKRVAGDESREEFHERADIRPEPQLSEVILSPHHAHCDALRLLFPRVHRVLRGSILFRLVNRVV
jgi:hypothetical protein